jgi:hypothetical protein
MPKPKQGKKKPLKKKPLKLSPEIWIRERLSGQQMN